MKRLLYEFTESFRIAFAQIRANKMRSMLTALGVIIGIVAVTLMGTAINGIDRGFQNSMAMLGDDVLYVQKWPWGPVEDWWNYINRPIIRPEMSEKLNRIIEDSPNSLLQVAAPVAGGRASLKVGENQVSAVQIIGTTASYSQMMSADFKEGRLFNETEAAGGRQVCVLGFDVAEALFPIHPPLGESVLIKGQPFTVIGVLAKQGSFLGIFSFDSQAIVPLNAYRKYFGANSNSAQLRVKVTDKTRMDDAKEELIGAMRRVRGQLPGERDNFSINQQQSFREQLDPIKKGIAMAGLFITGLALFVGAIGIMNITFVSVKERTKEIGTRKALGARRRTILLQFLIEAVSICLIGGVIGLTVTFGLCLLIQLAMPSLPVVFSMGLVVVSVVVSIATGIVSGFAPAWGASRLDPVVALRYE
ncbi:MAG: ABC transporter permease [Opitutaceae bacterium]|nr:ABC transporter permease [Opitutaceae bacterium]MBP9913007.1 ABC transporter permease [Opitutaceae bacterium]